MNLRYFAFYIFAVASLSYFDIIDVRPLRAFINSPFDEQARYFPEFFEWKREFEGKFNVIFLRYG